MTYNVCMKTKTFNVSMPSELVEKIDLQSKLQGSNRSDFIRRAVYRQLSTLEQWQALTGVVRQQYKGKALTETQVADIVRGYRASQTR